MPRRRSARDNDDEDRPTYLAKPHDVVDLELEARIAKGRELLAQMDVHVVPQPGRVEELSAEFRAWHNYNRAYLEGAFTTKEIREEYEGVFVGFVSGGPESDLDRLRDLVQDLQRDLNKLVDIKGRLALYEAHERQVQSAAPPAAPQRHPPIHVTFQGQVGQVTFADLIQRVDAEIAQVDQRGEATLAEALQQLTNAVQAAADAQQDKREDALDAIAVLAEVGSAPPEERGKFRGRVRGAIEVIKDLVGVAPDVKKAWDAWGPTVMEHLPRLGS